jgi:hypothetical protein
MTLVAIVEAYRGGDLTRDELYAGLTKMLSATPTALQLARAELNFEPSVRAGFEAWLEELRSGPEILLGGRHVIVTNELISALDAAERMSTLAPAQGQTGTSAATRAKPTLGSRAIVQTKDVCVNA